MSKSDTKVIISMLHTQYNVESPAYTHTHTRHPVTHAAAREKTHSQVQ